MNEPFFTSKSGDFTLFGGDCLEILPTLKDKFDMIFADPPYFLSNGGISCHAGKQVLVDKGEWDKSNGFEADNDFNRKWILACKNALKENGTIWISGTFHNIFSVAQMLNELDFKVLNCVTWVKTNPAPNLACRSFAHSTEFVLWARKSKKTPHFFDYEEMKKINGGKQMKDVWEFPTSALWEKSYGKHPTQKPLSLLVRIILASTEKGALVLDPFAGSATTGVAANLFGRRFVGIERENEFLQMAKNRRLEIENASVANEYRKRSFERFCKTAEANLFSGVNLQ